MAASGLLLAGPVVAATVTGTAGDDVLRGTSGNDVIRAGARSDRVDALHGDDVPDRQASEDIPTTELNVATMDTGAPPHRLHIRLSRESIVDGDREIPIEVVGEPEQLQRTRGGYLVQTYSHPPGASNPTYRVYSLDADGQRRWMQRFAERVAVSPDGRRVALVKEDTEHVMRSVQVRAVADGDRLAVRLRHGRPEWPAAYGSGRVLLESSGRPTVRWWTPGKGVTGLMNPADLTAVDLGAHQAVVRVEYDDWYRSVIVPIPADAGERHPIGRVLFVYDRWWNPSGSRLLAGRDPGGGDWRKLLMLRRDGTRIRAFAPGDVEFAGTGHVWEDDDHILIRVISDPVLGEPTRHGVLRCSVNGECELAAAMQAGSRPDFLFATPRGN